MNTNSRENGNSPFMSNVATIMRHCGKNAEEN